MFRGMLVCRLVLAVCPGLETVECDPWKLHWLWSQTESCYLLDTLGLNSSVSGASPVSGDQNAYLVGLV